MKKLANNIFMLLATLALCPGLGACSQDIDLSDQRDAAAEHTLTLNSILCPDSVLAVAATTPYFFTDDHSQRIFVRGLAMTYQINGGAAREMAYNAQRNLYMADVRPKAGDTVRISTTYDGYEVSAEDVVPQPCPIESVTVTRRGPVSVYSSFDFVLTYKLTFTDTPGRDDYYFLQWEEGDAHKDLRIGERDFTKDLVFQRLANQVRESLPGWTPYSPFGLPFTDKGIEGQRYTITVEEILQGDIGSTNLAEYDRMRRKFTLYAISKPYYDYLVTSLVNLSEDKGWQGGMVDLGLANPEKIYSNISRGAGILGCYNSSSQTIDPIQVLGKFPER